MDDKKSILLLMYRKVLAEFIVNQLRETTNLKISVEYNYQNIEMSVDIVKPDLLLFEIPESGGAISEQYIDNCRRLKNLYKDMKLLLLVSEKEPDIEYLVVDIIKEKTADDFLFYDTSMKYLISKVRSLV